MVFSRFQTPAYATCVLFFLGLIAFGLAVPTVLETADLGRHIVNGALTLDHHLIAQTNFYSYTHPDFPVTNHHWGSGVLFYLTYKYANFVGLRVLYITLMVSACALTLKTTLIRSKPWYALLSMLPFIPLWMTRAEIRPEGFSYLFCAITISLLQRSALTKYKIIALIILQVLWVNLHIYFILGPLLILAHGLPSKFKSKDIWTAFLLSLAASCLNPQGLKGLIEPFTIFHNYGYRVLENQNLIFLYKILNLPIIPYFSTLSAAIVLAAITVSSLRPRSYLDLTVMLISLAWLALGFSALRNLPLTALIAPILLARALTLLSEKIGHAKSLVLASIIFSMVGWQAAPLTTNSIPPRSLGLYQNSGKSLEFFRKLNLKGPIFNNYDIGGMLIFGLYPSEKVFVDNRPEAYPAHFFTETLVPMQERNEIWHATDQQYKFNIIYFYRLDLTNWAQTFLIARINDPEWAPIYVDELTILFIRRTAQNSAIINDYEIPRSVFQFK